MGSPELDKAVPSNDVIVPAKDREDLVLADYGGVPICSGGVKLSAGAQAKLFEIVSYVYGHRYSRVLHLETSDEDKAAFAADGSTNGADTYGELSPQGFLKIMFQAGAKPGQRFYDLGAGVGKLATLAWMLGLRSTGIELATLRWQAARAALGKLEQLTAPGKLASGESRLPERVTRGLDQIHGSIFEVDFLDADIIFLSSVMFAPKMVENFAELARWMKPGSKLICYQRLDEVVPDFRVLGECSAASSWNETSMWVVHELACGPLETEQPPAGLRKAEDLDSARRICLC